MAWTKAGSRKGGLNRPEWARRKAVKSIRQIFKKKILAKMLKFGGTKRWMQRAHHGRWHIKRGIINPQCEFCRRGK